jgi:hypothetical protein
MPVIVRGRGSKKGVKRTRPDRKGTRPFVMFKGGIDELRHLEDGEIFSAFERGGGVPISTMSASSRRRMLGRIRGEVGELIENLQSGGQRNGLAIVPIGRMGTFALRVRLLSRKTPGGVVYDRVAIHQQPFVHGVRRRGLEGDLLNPYQAFRGILEEGFRTRRREHRGILKNVLVAGERKHLATPDANNAEGSGFMGFEGDEFGIEIMGPAEYVSDSVHIGGGLGAPRFRQGFVRSSSPDKILSARIRIASKDPKEIKRRRARYQRELMHLGIPLHFH